MRLSDFDYDLPPDRIAQRPLPERSGGRMLVIERRSGLLRHSAVSRLGEELAPGDLLVLNDSRVFPARLHGETGAGRAVEALFIRTVGEREWVLLLRPSRRVRKGAVVRFPGAGLEGSIIGPADEGEWVVRFSTGPPIEEALERAGEIPLPPYIRRPPTGEDRDRYQTVFARETGSVAAPTAGLHFTDELLRFLADRSIGIAFVTLHVGPGTFRPLRSEEIEAHRMEPEPYRISEECAEAVRKTREAGGRVVAVGTTAVRALEAAAEGRAVRPGAGWTDLFLYPPFEPRVVDALLTNFHLPRSTLLLLVSAFAGRERMLDAYRVAVETGYRFYSYGDCTLIL